MTKKELIGFRSIQASDMAFVYRTWLMGAYHGNRPQKGVKPPIGSSLDYIGSINQDDFMRSYHRYLENLLGTPGVITCIACLKSDPDVILGFSVFQSDTLHWVFVKKDWRRIGLCNDLLPPNLKTVTGFTRVGEVIRKRKSLTFNPFR